MLVMKLFIDEQNNIVSNRSQYNHALIKLNLLRYCLIWKDLIYSHVDMYYICPLV